MMSRLVARFLIGCGCFVAILRFRAVALPRSLTWNIPDAYTLNQEVERFADCSAIPMTSAR